MIYPNREAVVTFSIKNSSFRYFDALVPLTKKLESVLCDAQVIMTALNLCALKHKKVGKIMNFCLQKKTDLFCMVGGVLFAFWFKNKKNWAGYPPSFYSVLLEGSN